MRHSTHARVCVRQRNATASRDTNQLLPVLCAFEDSRARANAPRRIRACVIDCFVRSTFYPHGDHQHAHISWARARMSADARHRRSPAQLTPPMADECRLALLQVGMLVSALSHRRNAAINDALDKTAALRVIHVGNETIVALCSLE